MGQRAHYIVKSGERCVMYYTHWRSDMIAKDLMLGPRRFLRFVREFERVEELLPLPLLEGCVLIDIDTDSLLFWESSELEQYSVLHRYLEKLSLEWKGWNVEYASRRMVDIERMTGLSYPSCHHFFLEGTVEEMDMKGLSGLIEESRSDRHYPGCYVMIREKGEVVVWSAPYKPRGLLAVGPEMISVLQRAGSCTRLPEEREAYDDAVSTYSIDVDAKRLRLAEDGEPSPTIAELWSGWSIESEYTPYLQILKDWNVDIEPLRMGRSRTDAAIAEFLNVRDDFDPTMIPKRALSDGRERGVINPRFFENIKPKGSLWRSLKRWRGRE